MTLLLVVHLLGMAMGLGGATIGALLFLKSIADNRIDFSEYKLLVMTSRATFFGMFLLYVSGAGFMISGAELSDSFWAKMAIVGVVTVTESVTLAFFLPLLRRCADHDINLTTPEFTDYVPLMASVAAISLLSWYTALILGVARNTMLPFGVLMGIYACMMVFFLIAANVAAWWMKQIKQHSDDQYYRKVETENAYVEHAIQSAQGSRETIKGVNFDDELPELAMESSATNGALKGVQFDDFHPELEMPSNNNSSRSLKGVDYSGEHPALEIEMPPTPKYAG